MGAGLLLVLGTHLLPALLAGLLVCELIDVLSPLVRIRQMEGNRARLIAVALLSAVVVSLLTLLTLAMIRFSRHGSEGLPVLLTQMATILEDSRRILPTWVMENFPTDADDLKAGLVEWLKDNALAVQAAGKTAGRVVGHILIGMIIGALVSLSDAVTPQSQRPLAAPLIERLNRLGLAFRRIVFAQVRIAAINTFFTGIYLVVVLPLLGIHLPLTKTLIAVTFVAGLLPVIGNLISNTIIVVVSLSHSLPVAFGSLAFLVVIHKLEYFLNARIIGTRIRARAWELLAAMLLMESMFGIAGVVAAPVYYAYLKDELGNRGLI
jgi:predicted PurR-regulated permease PerM